NRLTNEQVEFVLVFPAPAGIKPHGLYRLHFCIVCSPRQRG
ncbi:hypothetical protein SEES004_15766, partial [Salmonella enterica subsp. enterica serovar Senftenberg str. 361154004]